MIGAIIGDIVGSRFEFDNYRRKDFELFDPECFPTDDSIMTLAVGKSLAEMGSVSELPELTVRNMQALGRQYPNCGFGGMFDQWIWSAHPEPYDSFGNGAAMRISPVGFFARTEEETKSISRAVTAVSHNHPEGIKGAEATAMAIYLARQGMSKERIKARIEQDYYAIDFTIDEVRPTYQFNETCQDTVPQALECFFESEGFEDCIRIAISLGGDSDTVAAIAGGVAEAYYGVPDEIKRKALTYLDVELLRVYREVE